MAPPPTQLTLLELAEATGQKPRTLRYWISLGLLPSPPSRGSRTTYGPEHLTRARAVTRLRDAGVHLDEIKRRFAKSTREELARLGAPPPPRLDAPPEPPPEPVYPAERWERVALLPGLELAVRADAPPLVRRIVADIYAHYGGFVVG